MYGWRGRIGLIVASSDPTVEMAFHEMKPEGVAIYVARVPLLETNAPKEKLKALEQMDAAIPAAARLLADVEPDIVAFCCTAGSVLKGIGTDERIIETIERETGARATTTSTAIVEQLRHLQISRIDLLTPFTEKFSTLVQRFLCENVSGLRILNCRDLGIVGALPKCKVSPYLIYSEAKRLVSSDSQALLISCTSFQLRPIIRQLEQDIGKPVITGNTATMWLALKKLHMKKVFKDKGELLAGLHLVRPVVDL